jgi:hypothetical protein
MGRMAKGIHFTGTIGNICYYEVDDRTFVRSKGSLTKKRVLEDKEFEKTRKFAGDLGRASRIGSFIYKALPADIKGRWIFRAITGEAASLLYEGKSEQVVKDLLYQKYIQDTGCENEPALPSTKKVNQQFHVIFLDRWQKQNKPVFYFKRAWTHRKRFNPDTIPRRSEYFLGMKQAARIWN